MTEELTISEVSKQYGVTYRTLRYYEEEGLVRPRRQGEGRLYDNEVLTRIEMILLARRLGFSLAEIKEIVSNANTIDCTDLQHLLSNQQVLDQIEFLERRREEIDKAIEVLDSWRRRPM